MNKFIVDGRYAELLNSYGIRVEEALRKAELPGDAFCHKAPVMEEDAYYRFMDAAGSLIRKYRFRLPVLTRLNLSPLPFLRLIAAKMGTYVLSGWPDTKN